MLSHEDCLPTRPPLVYAFSMLKRSIKVIESFGENWNP